MIENLDDTIVSQKINTEIGKSPIIGKIFESVKSSQGAYKIDASAEGLDFYPSSKSPYRLKIWTPSGDEILAWFYRKSAIPHSRDRFSYGGVMLKADSVDLNRLDDTVKIWLAWLDSTFQSENRPGNWSGSFEFDIPY